MTEINKLSKHLSKLRTDEPDSPQIEKLEAQLSDLWRRRRLQLAGAPDA